MREIEKAILVGLFCVFATSSGCGLAEPSGQTDRRMKTTAETREDVANWLVALELEHAALPSRLALINKLYLVDTVKFAPEFAHALGSSEPIVRDVACKKLENSDYTAALKPLIKILKSDPHAGVRTSAASALGSFKSADPVPALLEAAQMDFVPEVRRFAALSLGELKASEAIVLAKRLQTSETDASVIEAIIRTLTRLRDTAAVPYLIHYFVRSSDPAALTALGNIGGSQAGDFLKSTLQDTSLPLGKLYVPASLLRFDKGPYDEFLISQARTNGEAAVRSAIYRAAKEAQLPQERWQSFMKVASEHGRVDEAPEVRKAAEELIKYGSDHY